MKRDIEQEHKQAQEDRKAQDQDAELMYAALKGGRGFVTRQ